MAQSTPVSDSLQPEALSWAALLGRWMDFARASVALPATREGDQWRESVVPMITLQAVTFAVSELEQVAPAERLLGWDRAELLSGEAAESLDDTWGPVMPAEIADTIQAAEAAIIDVLNRMTLVLVSDQAKAWTMTCLDAVEPVGAFAAAAAGTPIMPGTPIAWWSEVELDAVRGQDLPGTLHLLTTPVQVWRCWDEQDRFWEDVVTDLEADRPHALPLLVPRVLEGLPLSDPLPSEEDVRAYHASQMSSSDLPLRWEITP